MKSIHANRVESIGFKLKGFKSNISKKTNNPKIACAFAEIYLPLVLEQLPLEVGVEFLRLDPTLAGTPKRQ